MASAEPLCSRHEPYVGVGGEVSSCGGFAAHGANHSVEKAGDRVSVMMQSAAVKVGIEVDALGEQIAEMSAHIDAAMHRLLTAIREFDSAAGWYVQGALSCAHWLAWRVGWDLRTARERVRVARKLAELPLVDEQLRLGAMSYSQARAISRVATAEKEALWVAYAKRMPASQLDTLCRAYGNVQAYDQARGAEAGAMSGAEVAARVAAQRTVTRRSLDNGMVKFEIVLPSDEAAIVWAALNAAIDTAKAEPSPLPQTPAEHLLSELTPAEPTPAEHLLSEVSPSESTPAKHLLSELTPAEPTQAEHLESEVSPSEPTPAEPTLAKPPAVKAPTSADRGRLRADAFMNMIQERVCGNRLQRTPVEIIITVPHAGLHGSAEPLDLATMADGDVIATATARRYCCDAGVVVAQVDAQGVPLSVGRKTRTIPAAIKRALLLRDRTCRFPGCTHSRYVDGHHIEHWANGGETSLSNLMLLCNAHHTLLHEGGCRVEANGAGGWDFFDHRNRIIEVRPARTTSRIDGPQRGLAALHNSHAVLGITVNTNTSKWTGEPIDYATCIDYLM